ncbi:MAG: hypothetical protein WCF98_12470 [Synechococcus sp. ELA057]
MASADATPVPPTPSQPAGEDHPHDFEVQKRIHQTIRNDPDYDDWEYGTEPLPHEGWLSRQGGSAEAVTPADAQPGT